MKTIAFLTASVLLADIGSCEATVPTEPLKWSILQQVIEEPSSVSKRILEVYSPSVHATNHIQIPHTSPHPHTDIEVTLWKSIIPGIAIVTTKTNKSYNKALEGKVRLTYLAVDVDAYTKYLKSSGVRPEDLLTIKPDIAQAKFPNARYGSIDSKGTGTISQRLPEYGDDLMAFLCMRFEEGQIKSLEIGKNSVWIQEQLEKKTAFDHKQQSEQAAPSNP